METWLPHSLNDLQQQHHTHTQKKGGVRNESFFLYLFLLLSPLSFRLHAVSWLNKKLKDQDGGDGGLLL